MSVTLRQIALVLVVILCPAAALAQGPASQLGSPITVMVPPPAPAQQTSPWSTPRPALASSGAMPSQTMPSPRDTRSVGFFRTFGYAWAGWGIGLGVGGLGGFALGAATCQGGDLCFLSGLVGASLGAVSTAPLGAGLAAWGFSDLHGGTGNAFAAIGGAYLGTGIGMGLGYALSGVDATLAGVVGVASTILLTNLGAALGYQLTSHGTRKAGSSHASVVVMPSITAPARGQGAVVGVAGMF